MDKNEYIFAKNIINLDKNIYKAIEYIKENFNVESEYNEDNSHLRLWTNNINEDNTLLATKKCIEEVFGDYITVHI